MQKLKHKFLKTILLSLIIILIPPCFASAAVNWDLLDEDCSDISDWREQDYYPGISEVSPAGQFRFNGGDAYAIRWRDISGYPDTFTAEIKLYHDVISAKADYGFFALTCIQADEFFISRFASDGLFLRDTTDRSPTFSGDIEVGTDLVKQGANAEWQTWRFLVTFTGVTGDGTCDVYLNDSTHNWEKVGMAIPCSFVGAPSSNGMTYLRQDGSDAFPNMETHIDYIKMVAGLYVPGEPASYYVKPDGNDNLDGLSDATAWKTIGKVNSFNFSTGDDVYFKCGGTWKYGTEQWTSGSKLNIDWSGTADNRVVVGAYYGDGVIGVSGSKPVIDGNDQVPGPIPCETGCYSSLVQINNQNYINLENIYLKNSEGYGSRPEDSNNINFYNVKTENTYRSGIHFHNCNTESGSSIVEGCEVTEYARVWPEYCKTHGCTWPAGIASTGTNNLTIRKNIVHEGHGEGIYFGNLWPGQNGSNALIEDNIVYDSRAVSIYTHNAGDIVIKRNLVYGTGNPTYCNRFVYDGVYFAGPGIYVTDEDWPAGYQMDNIKIYDNLVAFTSSGIHIGNSRNSFSNSEVYNNIFIDNYKSITVTGSRASNSYIKNNIFWCISNDCTQAQVPNIPSGLTFDYNLWSSTPDVDAKGANDSSYAAPQLLKTSGWRSLTGGELTGQEFTLQSPSPAIDAGTNLGSNYQNALDPTSTWPDNVKTLNQDDYSNWEIGGFVFAGTCTELWTCTPWSDWSECIENQQSRTRTCTDANSCGTTDDKPSETETQSCESPITYGISNFINLVSDWLKTENGLESDVNNDGVVNTRDLGIMMSNWSD